MTIKIYKKRTHWYFKYHCNEYKIGVVKTLDYISELLEQKIIYFKLDNKYDRENHIGTIVPDVKKYILFDPWPIGRLSGEIYFSFRLRNIDFGTLCRGFRVYIHLK